MINSQVQRKDDCQAVWRARSLALYGGNGIDKAFEYNGRGRTFNISNNYTF